MERYAKSCHRDHRQIIGAVANCYSLRNVHILHLGKKLQQLRLTLTVDNLAKIAASKFPAFYFQLIGINIVYAKLMLQIISKIRKSARQNSYFIACSLKHFHQAWNAFCYWQVFRNLTHH